MKKFECRVEKCVYGGDALARVDGCVCFIPGLLPGEAAEVELVEQKKSFCRCRVRRVIERSVQRRDPDCQLPDGSLVPGCVYAHAAYSEELRMKAAQLKELLGRLPGINEAEFAEPVGAEHPLGYRNKIRLHGAPGVLGYRREPSHRVVDVPECPLTMATINDSLRKFRHEVGRRYMRLGAEVLFRATEQDGAGWRGVGRREGTLPDVLHESVEGGELEVRAEGFFQVNPEMARRLTHTLGEWFEEDVREHPRIVDLFCGVGGLGLHCARLGAESLLGLESEQGAVACARRNAKRWGVDGTFSAVKLGMDRFELRGEMAAPRRTTLILDPPRGGVLPEMARQIAACGAGRIFYVSCDPATLARDLGVIIGGGYEVKRVRLFDLFPRTARFETLVELRRGASDGIAEWKAW